MNKVDRVIDAFVTGDYFIVFLVIVLCILLVLVLALIKSREEYNELLKEIQKDDDNNQMLASSNTQKDEEDEEDEETQDLMDDLKGLMASSKEDEIDADKPLIKQVDLKNIKTYHDEINDYQDLEEENAVITTEELEKKAKERREALGTTENQAMIDKYEEEQEKKAIISYEQLVKNASNITLSYKEEEFKDKNAPKVNKVEYEQKEISGAELYLEEEEFLKILKEFRISL